MRLRRAEWLKRRDAHARRADERTEGWRQRKSHGDSHPVEDFLFTSYRLSPAQLRRWHPGADVVLEEAPEYSEVRWYRTDPDTGDSCFDVKTFLAERGSTVRFIHDLLSAVDQRPGTFDCFCLHEWAMVYRTTPEQIRHTHVPLRLGHAGTDAVVDSHRVRCTHYDAFRFFTPESVSHNSIELRREDQIEYDQPGCLHATMDLYKWAGKLGPLVPGDLLLECFDLARRVRFLDMQSSPYDISAYGLPAIPIETAQGKADFVARQRDCAAQGATLRHRLLTIIAAATG